MTNSFSSELLIATRNAGKIQEFQSLLAILPLQLHSLAEFPEIREVKETRKTFAGNAALKAKAYARQTGLWTLADDSGLEVDALGGAPGIYSARYGGEGATDAERIQRLLSELSSADDMERRARFTCAIAIANPQARLIKICRGTCEGHIAPSPQGENGFGYDPIFIPDGYHQTFGELPPQIKHRISHRAHALELTRVFLLKHLQTGA